MKRFVTKAVNSITKACAPYEVRCSFGTRQAVWTMTQALEWVAYCGDVAVVVHRATGELIASRQAV